MSRENVTVVRTPLSTPATTRRNRSIDEVLFVRFPTLLSHLTSAVMHLPPRSRLRRAYLARLVRRGWAASDRGDLAVALCGVDPAVEVRWPESGAGAFPDLQGVYRGHEGYRQVWHAMHDPWDLDIRLEELLDAGDRLLVSGRVDAHGKGSGIEMSSPLIVLFTLRAGRVFREQYFNDRAEALEAAGLSE